MTVVTVFQEAELEKTFCFVAICVILMLIIVIDVYTYPMYYIK
jgi:hypothetical protein